MLKLYNTLTRKIEEFKPIKPPMVGLYTCGPTVYDYQHIGHGRTYIFADILRRVLEYNGYKAKQVMNITDVGHLVGDGDFGEDKMEKGARREGKTPKEIAKFYSDDFFKMLKKLNIERAQIICKATDHIQEMIALIKVLKKKGFTYKTHDGIYFNILKFSDYGKLSGFKVEEQKPGARVPVRHQKKHPADFALWKFATPKHLQQWESPWGRGFPGWHIECSAMSMKYLGETFDIHTGGVDHIQVHHNDEIAQSETATGKKFVNYWLHGEHLLVKNKKMAKSLQNYLCLVDLEKKGFHPLDFRYLTLTTHYRSRMNFTWKALEGAKSARRRLINYGGTTSVKERQDGLNQGSPSILIGCAEFEANFLAAINNDLNMPKALAVIWDLVKSDYPPSAKIASLLKFDKVLGLRLKDRKIERYKDIKRLPKKLKELVRRRERLRKEEKWQEADEIRQQIREMGYEVEDTGEGAKISRRNYR